MAEECPIDCQIKSQIECPIEIPIKCQLCQIECPIECPIKCQHICHSMECQNRMPGWMFYFGKMLGNVCQMECRKVCQITCHKKRFVRSYDVRKYAMIGLFFGRKSFGVSWPHPPPSHRSYCWVCFNSSPCRCSTRSTLYFTKRGAVLESTIQRLKGPTNSWTWGVDLGSAGMQRTLAVFFGDLDMYWRLRTNTA